MIFAVLAHKELYKALSGRIETSSFGMLETGSANVVDLIKDQYEVRKERYKWRREGNGMREIGEMNALNVSDGMKMISKEEEKGTAEDK